MNDEYGDVGDPGLAELLMHAAIGWAVPKLYSGSTFLSSIGTCPSGDLGMGRSFRHRLDNGYCSS